MRVTTETRPLDRLGQLGEFEQDSNTDSELESNTDSHTAQSKAHVARQAAAERGEEAPSRCVGLTTMGYDQKQATVDP